MWPGKFFCCLHVGDFDFDLKDAIVVGFVVFSKSNLFAGWILHKIIVFLVQNTIFNGILTLGKLIVGDPSCYFSENNTTHFHLLTPLPFTKLTQNTNPSWLLASLPNKDCKQINAGDGKPISLYSFWNSLENSEKQEKQQLIVATLVLLLPSALALGPSFYYHWQKVKKYPHWLTETGVFSYVAIRSPYLPPTSNIFVKIRHWQWIANLFKSQKMRPKKYVKEKL